MKILLIYPYCLEDRLHLEDVSVAPMGIYYIGALLKENHYDAEILNFHNTDRTPQNIKQLLAEKQPDVIGFSILNANRWGGIEIARIAKQISPKVVTVFGGIGATFLWDHFLTHFKEIDFVVIGEGEQTFLNLVRCIEKQDYDHIDNIRGIGFRKENRPERTPEPVMIQNIDTLPIPAKYFEYQHVSLTRGCPGNCTFCGSPLFWKRKVRFHSSEYFVTQLELLNKKGVSFFFFSDDTFTLRPDLVTDVCRKILEKGLKISWAAISHVNYVSEEVLCQMRKAGCVQISYGVESGSREIRELLNKNIKTEQIRKAFSLATKYGILARAYFIYGCPGENWSTVQETTDLILEIKPLSIIFYILDIFPGTALCSDFMAKFNAADDIWLKQVEDIMYFQTDPDLSGEMILAFGQKLRTSFYENISRFADEIEVTENEEFREMISDFFSKLAMTFSHGDYSRIEAIKNKDVIAEKLYKRSLDYHPNHHAYLGLGIIRQKNGKYRESADILSQGIEHYPHSEQLNMCLGISCMNMGEYARALPYFLKFPDSEEAVFHITNCYNALGANQDKLQDWQKK